MTIDDAKVIGAGTITLLCLFLLAQVVYHRIDLWAIVRHYVVVRLASDAGEIRSGANADAGDADDLRRGHMHQVNGENDTENAAEDNPIHLRQLAKTDLIVMLAVQRKEDGSYLWSSNEIKKFVPGTDGPIGEIIATVRGKKPAEPPARSIRKSASGEWEPVR